MSAGADIDSVLVTAEGRQKCIIVVGENADSSDIVEASRLAVAIGELSAKKAEIPVVEKASVTYENVPPGTCVVVTPLQLETLWYFDDFGVYGNWNDHFELWETHEEIQLYIEDITTFDPFFRALKGNGFLDFSTIYRIDNVRAPPYIWVYSYMEGVRYNHITGLQHHEQWNYAVIDPFFVYNEYIPEICLFGTIYNVVYIDTSLLVTGVPHLEYVYVYKDQPFRAGEYTISLLDVDVDHNKCYLRVQGPRIRQEFWMVLDPMHGFSPDVQEMGSEVVAVDYDNDGVTDYYAKTLTGLSELDVWGHSLVYRYNYSVADLVIDGVKVFIGETIGVYLKVYWIEDAVIWYETTCCDPFVIFPQYYDFQIRPEVVVAYPVQDAYVDEGLPLQNFGGLPFLSVRSFLNTNTRTFVRFNLPVLPEKAVLTKATLRLTPFSVPGPRVYEISRVTATWSESGITWANQPAALVTGTQINNFMEWDVTTDVQNFYTGTPNYGWRISDQSENSVIPLEILFRSRESITKPQLIIEYTFDCNNAAETIPHTLNWINTFYDDVNNDGIDPVYEIDIRLCDIIKTWCNPYFFEGPNYYYFVDFLNTSFTDGVDFTVFQTKKVGSYVTDVVQVEPWELIKLDVEITKEDAEYNWVLIGGMHSNVWVKKLVDEHIAPDDGSPVDWFVREAGYNLYTDPFFYGNKVLVVAGKTREDTQKAIQMLINDIRE
jgi:hypothetical protein